MSNQVSWLSGTLCLLLWVGFSSLLESGIPVIPSIDGMRLLFLLMLQLGRCLGSLCDLAFALEDSVLDMYVGAKGALENMEFGFSDCAMENGVLDDKVVETLELCSEPFSAILKEKSSI